MIAIIVITVVIIIDIYFQPLQQLLVLLHVVSRH